MKNHCSMILVAVFSTALLGCGGRQVQSLTVTPNTAATAANDGTVQFAVTGTLTDGTTAKSLPVVWSIGNPWSTAMIPCCVNLSSTGLAQCHGNPGAHFQITATAPRDPSMDISRMTMNTPSVSGTAQLTCQ